MGEGTKSETALLGVDWGLSRIRVLRIGQDGSLLEQREANDGILAESAGPFDVRLRRHLECWWPAENGPSILLSGMIGSDMGWQRAPYVDLPAGVAALGGSLLHVEGAMSVHIVPGIRQLQPSADVMRGEETEIAGFVSLNRVEYARLCLPGTHTKWVDLRRGRVAAFRTYMTGELRASLLSRGSLAPLDASSSSDEALRRGALARGALTNLLFQARAGRILGGLDDKDVADYVSGVLIASEVHAECAHLDSDEPLFLIATGALARAYGSVMNALDLNFKVVDPRPLTAQGLMAIAQAAGLVGETPCSS